MTTRRGFFSRILGRRRFERACFAVQVVMNAAAALVAGNKAPDLKEGALIAEESIDNGLALEKLDGLVRLSQSL